MYEGSSQIKRSSKSITPNIIGGYGRRNYENDFIRFVTFTLTEYNETVTHLEFLHETESLANAEQLLRFNEKYNTSGKMLNQFLHAIQTKHISEK